MPSFFKAIRLEAPKSMAKRRLGVSTRKQVLNRPPEPKASPQPTNVTLVVMRRDRSSGVRVGRTPGALEFRLQPARQPQGEHADVAHERPDRIGPGCRPIAFDDEMGDPRREVEQGKR